MNRKEILLYHRTNRALKGHKPAIVYLSRTRKEIYEGGQGDFIMSLGKEYLWFQKLSFFTKNLVPKKDFKIALDDIASYLVVQKNIATRILTFYTKNRNFVELHFFIGTSDTYESEANIKLILNALEERGIRHEKGSLN